MKISTPRGSAGGAAPPSPNLGPPRISETIIARRLKFYTHLDRTKCSFRAWQFPLGCAGGGQAADREASSCNAPAIATFSSYVYYNAQQKPAMLALHALYIQRCLSICPSHSGIVSKRGSAEGCRLHRRVAQVKFEYKEVNHSTPLRKQPSCTHFAS